MTLIIEGLNRILRREQVETHPESFSLHDKTILLLLWKMRGYSKYGIMTSSLYMATWNWIGQGDHPDDDPDLESRVLGAIEGLSERGFIKKSDIPEPGFPDDYDFFVLTPKGKFVARQIKRHKLETDAVLNVSLKEN